MLICRFKRDQSPKSFFSLCLLKFFTAEKWLLKANSQRMEKRGATHQAVQHPNTKSLQSSNCQLYLLNSKSTALYFSNASECQQRLIVRSSPEKQCMMAQQAARFRRFSALWKLVAGFLISNQKSAKAKKKRKKTSSFLQDLCDLNSQRNPICNHSDTVVVSKRERKKKRLHSEREKKEDCILHKRGLVSERGQWCVFPLGMRSLMLRLSGHFI